VYKNDKKLLSLQTWNKFKN